MISAFREVSKKPLKSIPEFEEPPNPLTMLQLVANKLKKLEEINFEKPLSAEKAKLMYEQKHQWVFEEKVGFNVKCK